MELINKYNNQLVKFCEQFNVNELYVFGSIVSGNFKRDSDIDFLVKFGDVEIYNYFDNYMDFKESLEKLFNRKVDIVEEQTLKNPVLIKSINRNKKKLYERANTKMAL